MKPSEQIKYELPRRRINGIYDEDSDLQIMLDLILEQLDEIDGKVNNHPT
jgi:hypothetical protein